MYKLAEKYGVEYNSIRSIKNGQSWKHLLTEMKRNLEKKIGINEN